MIKFKKQQVIINKILNIMKLRKKRGRLSPVAVSKSISLFTGMTYVLAKAYGMGRAATLTVARRTMLSGATKFNGSSHFYTVNFSNMLKNNETMTS